jgi:hypothetical protein
MRTRLTCWMMTLGVLALTSLLAVAYAPAQPRRGPPPATGLQSGIGNLCGGLRAGLSLSDRDARVDRDHDPLQIWRLGCVPDHRPRPQCTVNVVDHLGLKLLTTETRPLVFGKDFRQERRRETINDGCSEVSTTLWGLLRGGRGVLKL